MANDGADINAETPLRPYGWPGLANPSNQVSANPLFRINLAKIAKKWILLPGRDEEATSQRENDRLWTLLHELTHAALSSGDHSKTSKNSYASVNEDYRDTWTQQIFYTIPYSHQYHNADSITLAIFKIYKLIPGAP